jgi:hypothetical protein
LSKRAAKLVEIANLEKTLSAVTTAKPVSEEIDAVRRLIAGLDRLSPSDRYAARERINGGLQRLFGAIVINPETGRVVVRLDKPPYGNSAVRSITVVDSMPEGAKRLTGAKNVLAALKAGHMVGMSRLT